MADNYDLPFNFDPSAMAAGTTDLLASPDNRAALLAFGLGLMSPRGFGDTPTSQIGRAVGGAGETVSRRATEDLRERTEQRQQGEADSRQELRGSQAQLAESRANVAGANTNTAIARLELQRVGVEQTRERAEWNARMRIRMAHAAEVSRITRQNANNQLMGQPLLPIPTEDQFVQASPLLRPLANSLNRQATPTPTAGDESGVDDGTGTAAPAGYPPAPATPAARQNNTVYQTNVGPKRWVAGRGWTNP